MLEARYEELEDYLRHTFKLHRQEVLDDVFVKTVGKILRHAHKHDPAKSSEWTWMLMIGRQVAWQVLERLDKRSGNNPRAPVDVYQRGVRGGLTGWEADPQTPESMLMDTQTEE